MSWPCLSDSMSLRQFVLITKEMCLVQQTVWIRYITKKHFKWGRKIAETRIHYLMEVRKGEEFPFKRNRGACPSYLLKKVVLLSLGVFSLTWDLHSRSSCNIF